MARRSISAYPLLLRENPKLLRSSTRPAGLRALTRAHPTLSRLSLSRPGKGRRSARRPAMGLYRLLLRIALPGVLLLWLAAAPARNRALDRLRAMATALILLCVALVTHWVLPDGDPKCLRRSAKSCDRNMNMYCTGHGAKHRNHLHFDTIHHRRRRYARCLGGCVQGHSAISSGAPEPRTDPCCTPYAHDA